MDKNEQQSGNTDLTPYEKLVVSERREKEQNPFKYYKFKGKPVAKSSLDGRSYTFENGEWNEFNFSIEIQRELSEPVSKDEMQKLFPEALSKLSMTIGSEGAINEKKMRKTLFNLLYPDYLGREFDQAILKFSKAEIAKINQALDFTKHKHQKQYREENTPYYTHCIDTALNAIENGANSHDVQVCLLHDTIEDTDTKFEELAGKFGEEVAKDVISMSKIRNGSRIPDDQYYEGIEADPKLVRYKGYDRLSNALSMYLAPNWPKRTNYIKETREKIIPMVAIVDQNLAKKLDEAIVFIESHPNLTTEEAKRVQDLANAREIENKL